MALITDGESGSSVRSKLNTSLTLTQAITASAAELNIMDGVTASTAEINQLDDNTFDSQVNVPSIVVSGTNGSGHADLRWQASNPTAGGNHTALWADADGDINIKKDGGSVLQLATTDEVALKVTANSAITGATKTKVTYDSKGLVTAGADATTADIADSSNKRYVTDAQLTVIGNTSGTNTGDQLTFKTIAVSGQSDVVADTTTDTLTLVAGSNVTITTNATTDSITINAGSSTVTKISNTYTAQSSDDVIDCTSGTFNLTLPTAVGINGKKYTIKNSGTGIITIDTTSSQTIDGSLSLKLGTQYNSITVCSDGSNWIALHLRSVNIQTFTSSGTWTKPAGAKMCQVIALGAGGGGGSGRRGALTTARSGGSGGSSGALINYNILASALSASETITVGSGGTGGAGITADDTNGNPGGDGTDTTIGSILRAKGGKGGSGGTNANGTGGIVVGVTSWYEESGLSGGNANVSGGGSAGSGSTTTIKPTGGGAGGSKSAGDVNLNATAGGSITQNGGGGSVESGMTNFVNVNGGSRNGNGNVSIALPIYYGLTIGTGGGGADASNNSPGTAGGNAGGPGAGGGGAHGVTNGTTGGKGGDGGNGWCVIVTYL